VGIIFNGNVYCNVHPLGMPLQDWINDFDGTGIKTVEMIM